MFFVYVLKNSINDNLYKGMTNNIERRLYEHNLGKHKSTKPFIPWVLAHQEEFNTREEARIRELYFKSGEGREYLKKLLDS